MKQGMTRKLKPKPKYERKSWQRRNEARKSKQEAHQKPADEARIES